MAVPLPAMPYRKFDHYPRSSKTCTVYLLHFSKPFGHAHHYIGIATGDRPLSERLDEHRSGRGAKLCKLAVANGAELLLARVWEEAPRYTEIRLKNQGGAKRHCPICKAMASHPPREAQSTGAVGPLAPVHATTQSSDKPLLGTPNQSTTLGFLTLWHNGGDNDDDERDGYHADGSAPELP